MALSGCVINIGHLQEASSKSAQWNQEYELVAKNVIGKDVIPVYFIFPLMPEPSVEKAIDDALAQHGGDLMKNVSVKRKFWIYIPYVYEEIWMEVNGDVYKRVASQN